MKRIYFVLLINAYFLSSTFAQQFAEQSAVVGISHSFQAKALMGGGAAFFDYDNDGDEDVYITGGLAKDDLYRNNGDGTFSKVLEDIGLLVTGTHNTTGVTTGDIDNDGDRDIFVTTWEKFLGGEPIAPSLLLRNNGDGTFTDISASAGITQAAFGIGAMFMDYNKDSFLDIYVINHVETPGFLFDSTGVIVGFASDCYPNYLYRNNGNNTFTEVANDLGLTDLSCTLAAMPTDYDMDGDLDIYLANDFGPFIVPNLLYQNNYPEDSFQDVSEATGADYAIYGMGIAAGDYDHDQDLDYYVTNLGANLLLENENGTFTDVAAAAGVENDFTTGGEFVTGWGTAFFDIDNDTWEDLYAANGRIPSLPSQPTAMSDPDKLFRNNGDKTFTDITDTEGINNPNYSRGMSCADFDQDGDLDAIVVVINELGGTSKFYVNQLDNDNHYIRFKLVGTQSNRDAFGAKVWLYAGGEAYIREIYGGGSSFSSQHSSIAHFGLGQMDQIDSVRVEWPNGLVESLGAYAVDEIHILEEGMTTSTTNIANQYDQRLLVQPNPFEASIELQLKDLNLSGQTIAVQLFNASGQLILDRSLDLDTGRASLDLDPQLPAGMYLLNVRTAQHSFVRKLIKR